MSEKKKQKQVYRSYTQADIDDHAAKVGGKRNLRESIVTDDEGNKTAFLIRKPSRSVIQAMEQAEARKDLNKAVKLMMGCVLEGDMDLLDNDGGVFQSVLEDVQKTLNGTKSELKKL